MMELRFEMNKLPDVKAEPLTDSEQRIFLAALGRERGICEKVDAETRDMNDPEVINLVRICDSIEKKVRAALWT